MSANIRAKDIKTALDDFITSKIELDSLLGRAKAAEGWGETFKKEREGYRASARTQQERVQENYAALIQKLDELSVQYPALSSSISSWNRQISQAMPSDSSTKKPKEMRFLQGNIRYYGNILIKELEELEEQERLLHSTSKMHQAKLSFRRGSSTATPIPTSSPTVPESKSANRHVTVGAEPLRKESRSIFNLFSMDPFKQAALPDSEDQELLKKEEIGWEPDQPEFQRFLNAQGQPQNGYETARRELEGGKKQSHWIWYIFPQIPGLGESPNSNTYAICDSHQARRYLENPTLFERYSALVKIVKEQLDKGIGLASLFNGETDAQKFISSITLFELALGELSEAAVDSLKQDYEEVLENIRAIFDRKDFLGQPKRKRCEMTLRITGKLPRTEAEIEDAIMSGEYYPVNFSLLSGIGDESSKDDPELEEEFRKVVEELDKEQELLLHLIGISSSASSVPAAVSSTLAVVPTASTPAPTPLVSAHDPESKKDESLEGKKEEREKEEAFEELEKEAEKELEKELDDCSESPISFLEKKILALRQEMDALQEEVALVESKSNAEAETARKPRAACRVLEKVEGKDKEEKDKGKSEDEHAHEDEVIVVEAESSKEENPRSEEQKPKAEEDELTSVLASINAIINELEKVKRNPRERLPLYRVPNLITQLKKLSATEITIANSSEEINSQLNELLSKILRLIICARKHLAVNVDMRRQELGFYIVIMEDMIDISKKRELSVSKLETELKKLTRARAKTGEKADDEFAVVSEDDREKPIRNGSKLKAEAVAEAEDEEDEEDKLAGTLDSMLMGIKQGIEQLKIVNKPTKRVPLYRLLIEKLKELNASYMNWQETGDLTVEHYSKIDSELTGCVSVILDLEIRRAKKVTSIHLKEIELYIIILERMHSMLDELNPLRSRIEKKIKEMGRRRSKVQGALEIEDKKEKGVSKKAKVTLTFSELDPAETLDEVSVEDEEARSISESEIEPLLTERKSKTHFRPFSSFWSSSSEEEAFMEVSKPKTLDEKILEEAEQKFTANPSLSLAVVCIEEPEYVFSFYVVEGSRNYKPLLTYIQTQADLFKNGTTSKKRDALERINTVMDFVVKEPSYEASYQYGGIAHEVEIELKKAGYFEMKSLDASKASIVESVSSVRQRKEARSVRADPSGGVDPDPTENITVIALPSATVRRSLLAQVYQSDTNQKNREVAEAVLAARQEQKAILEARQAQQVVSAEQEAKSTVPTDQAVYLDRLGFVPGRNQYKGYTITETSDTIKMTKKEIEIIAQTQVEFVSNILFDVSSEKVTRVDIRASKSQSEEAVCFAAEELKPAGVVSMSIKVEKGKPGSDGKYINEAERERIHIANLLEKDVVGVLCRYDDENEKTALWRTYRHLCITADGSEAAPLHQQYLAKIFSDDTGRLKKELIEGMFIMHEKLTIQGKSLDDLMFETEDNLEPILRVQAHQGRNVFARFFHSTFTSESAMIQLHEIPQNA